MLKASTAADKNLINRDVSPSLRMTPVATSANPSCGTFFSQPVLGLESHPIHPSIYRGEEGFVKQPARSTSEHSAHFALPSSLKCV